MLQNVIPDGADVFRRRGPGEKSRRFFGICEADRMPVVPVVIRPHEREFQPVPVGCLQKTFIQCPLQIRSVIPVPVKYERIDPVIGRNIDLSGHDGRIGFIFIPPQRLFRLLVTGKTRTRRLHQFPFRPARTVIRVIAAFRMVIREIISCCLH